MADNSYDSVASSLLCAESDSLCFSDIDSPEKDEVTQGSNGHKGLIFGIGRSGPLIDLPCLSEEIFEFMIEREIEHLPKEDYLKRLRNGELDLSVRKDAIDWIWKAHSHFGFRDFSLVLSINYLDRFLSMYELPKSSTWAGKLLSLACLSLAAKIEEINVPLTVDLQVLEPKFVFDAETIQRMELLILNTLKWRMQSYTPCIFIDHFLRKINNGDDDDDDDEMPSGPLISRSMQIILSTAKGIDFLEFRPSEIAASVAIFVSGDTTAGEDILMAMPCFAHQVLHKERVVKCVELIQDMTITSGTTSVGSGSSSPAVQSPNGVLEAACLSYKSDERAVGSCPSSSHTSPDSKRRRLDTSMEGN